MCQLPTLDLSIHAAGDRHLACLHHTNSVQGMCPLWAFVRLLWASCSRRALHTSAPEQKGHPSLCQWAWANKGPMRGQGRSSLRVNRRVSVTYTMAQDTTPPLVTHGSTGNRRIFAHWGTLQCVEVPVGVGTTGSRAISMWVSNRTMWSVTAISAQAACSSFVPHNGKCLIAHSGGPYLMVWLACPLPASTVIPYGCWLMFQ